MDVSLSETQTLIRDSLRNYLTTEVPWARVMEIERNGGYDQSLWSYLAESGWLSFPFPEDMGGQGGELTDMAVIQEELSRRASFVPFMETMASAVTIQRRGEAALAKGVVKAVIDGKMMISPAVLEAADSFDDIQLEVGADGKITGKKYFVDYGQYATHHLVAAKKNGVVELFLIDASNPTVKAQPLHNLAQTPQAVITYEGTPSIRAAGNDGFKFLLQLARAMSTVQCLGSSEGALAAVVEYTPMRVQFGQPIGSFQAVQCHAADMATAVVGQRFLAYEAMWAMDKGVATDRQLAIAKAWAAKSLPEITQWAHVLHAGIGVAEEHHLHFFSTQGKERTLAWGSYDECLKIIGETIGEQEEWL